MNGHGGNQQEHLSTLITAARKKVQNFSFVRRKLQLKTQKLGVLYSDSKGESAPKTDETLLAQTIHDTSDNKLNALTQQYRDITNQENTRKIHPVRSQTNKRIWDSKLISRRLSVAQINPSAQIQPKSHNRSSPGNLLKPNPITGRKTGRRTETETSTEARSLNLEGGRWSEKLVSGDFWIGPTPSIILPSFLYLLLLFIWEKLHLAPWSFSLATLCPLHGQQQRSLLDKANRSF